MSFPYKCYSSFNVCVCVFHSFLYFDKFDIPRTMNNANDENN